MRLHVRDDGKGAVDTTGGFGLLGIRERAEQLKGLMNYETAPGQGFRLFIELPA